MKNSMFKSFRFEIIVYTFLSMLYTLLTIAVVLLGCGIVYFSLGGKLPIYVSMNEQSAEPVLENSSPVLSYSNSSNLIGNKSLPELPRGDSYRVDSSVVVIGIICIAILAVLLFLLYFMKLTKKFSHYMDSLNEGIDEISHGNFNYSIEVMSNDEFGEIARKINQMIKDVNQIIEANRVGENRKHELITSVAHDLRTPLTSVMGYLELLRSRELEEETKAHYTDIVYQKAKRLEHLIEDLFSYTKYTYGEVASINQPVDLVKLLEQLVDEFYPSFEENGLTFQFYKDCNSLVSYADGNLLARAFANLIGNAIKYGVEGKKVELFFAHRSDDVQIIVKNYGAIIPEEDLPHIFERFYRVEDSRSQETGGSGLGLAIAKSIVAMHHGEITARSSLSGTVFEVRLPIIREPEKQ